MGRPRLPREPDLDPIQPLKAARERREALRRQRLRQHYLRQIGRVCDILVHLLHQAKVGTPRLIIPPLPIWNTTVFQVTTPRRVVRDWRSLPIPDIWTRKPGPAKTPLKTHGYGSPVRKSWI